MPNAAPVAAPIVAPIAGLIAKVAPMLVPRAAPQMAPLAIPAAASPGSTPPPAQPARPIVDPRTSAPFRARRIGDSLTHRQIDNIGIELLDNLINLPTGPGVGLVRLGWGGVGTHCGYGFQDRYRRFGTGRIERGGPCGEEGHDARAARAAEHVNDTIFKYQKRKHVMATPELLLLRSDIDSRRNRARS